MSRLIAFGCSNTFGESLPDAERDSSNPSLAIPGPSKYSWPFFLGNKINAHVVNLGINGGSNKQIWKLILNQEFKKSDIVVILWTSFYRTCFFSTSNTTYRILPAWADIKHKRPKDEYNFNKNYYKNFFFEENLNLESFLCIDHVKKYLDNKNIENYHFTFFRNSKRSPLPINNIKQPIWFTSKLQPLEFIDDLASDNDHPSVLAHQDFANKIYEVIGSNLPTSM